MKIHTKLLQPIKEGLLKAQTFRGKVYTVFHFQKKQNKTKVMEGKGHVKRVGWRRTTNINHSLVTSGLQTNLEAVCIFVRICDKQSYFLPFDPLLFCMKTVTDAEPYYSVPEALHQEGSHVAC